MLLAEHFAQRVQQDPEFSSEVMDRIYDYSWPGNVRELKAVIELAAGRAEVLGDEHILLKHMELPKNSLRLIEEEGVSPKEPSVKDLSNTGSMEEMILTYLRKNV